MYDDNAFQPFAPKLAPNIVCVGGGTGTFTVLRGLRSYEAALSAVVGMADDGGSNRRIRDEFGMLPTSDIRQCLVALAKVNGNEQENILRKLFMYRFSKGEGVSGHTFGNLFLAALTDILGSEVEAIKAASKVLNIKGEVVPVTIDKTRLVALYEDGSLVRGEHYIDEPQHNGELKITNLRLDPKATIYPRAKEVLSEADLIVLGPGDLHTSILQNVIVEGVREAISQSSARVVYVLNLMTKYGQTYGFSASDHVHEMEKYLGQAVIDAVMVNTTPLPQEALTVYQDDKDFPVQDDLGDNLDKIQIIRGDFIDPVMVEKTAGDNLTRSLIRHSSDKIAKALMAYYQSARTL